MVAASLREGEWSCYGGHFNGEKLCQRVRVGQFNGENGPVTEVASLVEGE